MANQRDAMKSCRVCKEIMNGCDRQPVCLPGCGHSFCRACLIMINNVDGEVKCPNCRSLHCGLPPEELPVNWTLWTLLEPDEEEENEKNSGTSPRESDAALPKHTSEASPPSGNCYYENDSPKAKNDSEFKGCSSSDSNQKDSANSSSKADHSKILKGIGIAAAATTGAVGLGIGLVAAAPVVLTGMGFTSAGIAAGSWATGMMSSAAIANGGGVIAGTLVPILQSAGAAGIGTAATATLGAAGAGVGAGVGTGIGYGASNLFGRSSNDGNEGNGASSKGKSTYYITMANNEEIAVNASLKGKSQKQHAFIYASLSEYGGIMNHMIIQNDTTQNIRLHQYYLNWGQVQVVPEANLPALMEDECLLKAAGGLAATGSSGIITYDLDNDTYLHILWDCPYNFNHYCNFIGLYLTDGRQSSPTADLFNIMYQDVSDPGINPKQHSPYDLVCCGPGERTSTPTGRITWGIRRLCEVTKGDFCVSMTMGDSHKTSSTVTIKRTRSSPKPTRSSAPTVRCTHEPHGIMNYIIIQNYTTHNIKLHQYYLNWGQAQVVPEANLPALTEDECLFHAAGGWAATGSSGIITYELDNDTFLHILWDCPYNFNHYCNFIGLYLADASQRNPTADLFNIMYQDVSDPGINPKQHSSYDLVCCGPGERTSTQTGRKPWGVRRPCEVTKGDFSISMTMGDSHKTSSTVTIKTTRSLPIPTSSSSPTLRCAQE